MRFTFILVAMILSGELASAEVLKFNRFAEPRFEDLMTNDANLPHANAPQGIPDFRDLFGDGVNSMTLPNFPPMNIPPHLTIPSSLGTIIFRCNTAIGYCPLVSNENAIVGLICVCESGQNKIFGQVGY